MAMPILTSQQIDNLVALVGKYISEQRGRYAAQGSALSAQQMASMRGFFLPQILEGTRLVTLRGERVTNPDFYPMLRNLGFSNLPNQSGMNAITFCDIVVSHVAVSSGLLFHELVHAEQYRQLGLRRFAELYVRGFLTGGSYDAIPLEVNAYALGRRYENEPTQVFSVADEVRAWIAGGRF